ncbi:MAG: hypothetical protein RL186_971 [Pseudomonadota bacterium]
MNQVPAPGLFFGRTVHVRFAPFSHKLTYDIFQVLLDIDALPATLAGLKWMTHNRFGAFSFYERDHGDRSGAPLRPWVEARLAEAGVDLAGGPIRLLTFPRVLGYVFNPLSVFFAYRPSGELAGVIYEVNNTFGETHSYVAPATNTGIERHSADKVFHVSPFFDVSGRYAFTLRAPDDHLSLVIDKYAAGVRDHVATLKARRLPLDDKTLAFYFFAMPFLTLKVIAAIHFEALKLLFKGARYHHPPKFPPKSSIAISDPTPNRTQIPYD